MEGNDFDESVANYSQVESANAINISMFEDNFQTKKAKLLNRSHVMSFSSRNEGLSNSY